MEIPAEWRVLEWEPSRRQVHRIETPVSSATITVEVLGDVEDARLRVAADSRLLPRARSLGRPLERALVKRVLARRIRRRLSAVEAGIDRS